MIWPQSQCVGSHWRHCLYLRWIVSDGGLSSFHTKRRGSPYHGPLTRYVKLRVAHAPEMPGRFFPPPLVSDSDMHHGTCVTDVPWCMPGSLTGGFLWSQWRGNIPGIPGHAQPEILRIWQEAHSANSCNFSATTFHGGYKDTHRAHAWWLSQYHQLGYPLTLKRDCLAPAQPHQ